MANELLKTLTIDGVASVDKTERTTKMKLSNRLYDTLKWITTIVLPALGTLYFALSGIWGFPYGEQIVGTITAIVTFLGVILGISNYQYKEDGQTQMFNEDLLKDMVGYDERVEDIEESEVDA